MLALVASLPFFLLLALPIVFAICTFGPSGIPLPAKVLIGIFSTLLGPPVFLWSVMSFFGSLAMVVSSLQMLVYGYASMIFLPFCAAPTGSPVSSLPVTILMSTFFLTYAGLGLCRFAADHYGLRSMTYPVQKMLQTGTLTLGFVPMLSVLFLGYRQRVLWAGSEPGLLMQLFMLVPALAQITKTAVPLVLPVFTGECIGVDPKTDEVPDDCYPDKKDAQKAQAFKIGIKVANAAPCVGAVLVLLGWGTYVFTPGPAPYTCVGILCCIYFAAYFGIFACRQSAQFLESDKKKEEMLKKWGSILAKIETALMTATAALNFTPMLCISFLLGRRLGGTESSWFETLPAIFGTTAILMQAVLSLAVPLLLHGDTKCGQIEGDMEYCVENRALGSSITIARSLMQFMLYILGAGMHLAWLFTRILSSCNADLPGMGAALVALLFWRTYIFIYFAKVIKEFTGFEWALMTCTFESSKGSVTYCPTIMILLLFIDPQIGGPLSFFVTYALPIAVLSQSIWIFLVMFCQGCPAQCDEDGCVCFEPEDNFAKRMVTIGKLASFGLLYGGMLVGCLSMFLSNF